MESVGPMESDNQERPLAHQDITAESLPQIRMTTTELAEGAGLDADRAERFSFAVHEVATNTVDHADSTGELTLVQDDATLIYAEVADHGPGMNGTVPTKRPPVDADRGRGLWLSGEMTDRMHIDSNADGTVVRLEMMLGDQPGPDDQS